VGKVKEISKRKLLGIAGLGWLFDAMDVIIKTDFRPILSDSIPKISAPTAIPIELILP